MQTEDIDTLFERIVIKLLITEKEIREKILPHLLGLENVDQVFKNKGNREIVDAVVKLVKIYGGQFPTPGDLKNELSDERFKNGRETLLSLGSLNVFEEYTRENILDKVSDFLKRRLVWTQIATWAEVIKSHGDLKKLDVEKLIDAKGFSFDSRIGTDVLGDDGTEFFKELHRKDTYISTGNIRFDEIMAGGFFKQAMTLFVAGTNTGKTLWKCSFAKQCLERGSNVLFITLEMPEKKIKDRIVVNLLDKTKSELLKMSEKELIEQYSSMAKLMKKRLIIKSYGEHELNSGKLRVYLKELREKTKFSPDIVFLDYLGLVSANVQSKEGNQAAQLKRASEEFHALAKEFDFALVTSMQFNRQGFKKNEPNMEEISESFATLFTADEVILITQNAEMNLAKRYNYRKVKARTPGKGLNGNFFVDYDKMRLYEDDSKTKPMERVDVGISIELNKVTEVFKTAQEKMKDGRIDLTPEAMNATMESIYNVTSDDEIKFE